MVAKRLSLRRRSRPPEGATLFSAVRIMQLFYLTPEGQGPRMLFHKVSPGTATILMPCEFDGERLYQYFPDNFPVYTQP